MTEYRKARIVLESGKGLDYLVDARAQIGDLVMVPGTYFRGPEGGTIHSFETTYEGELVPAKWMGHIR